MATEPGEDRRQEIRAFIRDHHPDRGGDPEEFRRGLEELRSPRPAPTERVRVEGAPSGPRLLRALRRRLARRGQPPRVR